jgi:ligand-binding sensor domain-containing protein
MTNNINKKIGVMKAYIIFTSMLIMMISSSSLAFDHIRFGKLSTRHGLSQSNVLCILQDSKGYMWFGTQNGLNVFNGYELKVFTNIEGNDNSLSNNVVHALYEDTDGNLWIGTEGGGLNQFHRETETFVHHLPENTPRIVSHPIIRTIYEDQNNVLWIGSYGGGIDTFDRKSGRVTHYVHSESNKQSLSCNHINVIYGDSRGNIWIGIGLCLKILFHLHHLKLS